MNILTLGLNSFRIDEEIKDYLLQIDGVKDVTFTSDETKENIVIKYDEKVVSIKRLKGEVLLFIDAYNSPIVVTFDKHSNDNLISYEFIVKDACCEICLSQFFEELLLVDGIEKASVDYDDSMFNVSINIEYNPRKISEKEILDLQNKFKYL